MKPQRFDLSRIAPAEGAGALPFLRVYLSGRFQRSFRIELGTYIAGRESSVDIPLEDRFVSRRHFQLEYHGENRLYIQDLQSSNGTFVNGKRVQRAPLAHGDEIRLGEIRVVISHPAYRDSNIIQFPEVRTEPGIAIKSLEALEPAPATEPPTEELLELEEELVFEPPPPPPISDAPSILWEAPSAETVAPPLPIRPQPVPKAVPPRVRPTRKPSKWRARIALVVTAVGMAAGIAAALNYFVPKRAPAVRVASLPSPPAIPPVSTPAVTLVEPVIPPAAPTALPRPVKKIVAKAPPKVAPVLPTPTASPTVGLVESLNALRGISTGGGDIQKALDKMKVAKAPPPDSNLNGLKKMGGAKAVAVDVDIELPRYEPERAATTGRRSKFDFSTYRSMLRSRIVGVEECYAQHAVDEKGGRISVWLSIASAGRVQKVGVDSSTFANKAMQECIVTRLQKIQVSPPPWDGYTVTYAFRFAPSKMKFD